MPGFGAFCATTAWPPWYVWSPPPDCTGIKRNPLCIPIAIFPHFRNEARTANKTVYIVGANWLGVGGVGWREGGAPGNTCIYISYGYYRLTVFTPTSPPPPPPSSSSSPRQHPKVKLCNIIYKGLECVPLGLVYNVCTYTGRRTRISRVTGSCASSNIVYFLHTLYVYGRANRRITAPRSESVAGRVRYNQDF